VAHKLGQPFISNQSIQIVSGDHSIVGPIVQGLDARWIKGLKACGQKNGIYGKCGGLFSFQQNFKLVTVPSDIPDFRLEIHSDLLKSFGPIFPFCPQTGTTVLANIRSHARPFASIPPKTVFSFNKVDENPPRFKGARRRYPGNAASNNQYLLPGFAYSTVWAIHSSWTPFLDMNRNGQKYVTIEGTYKVQVS
jgi:hypothetical protein